MLKARIQLVEPRSAQGPKLKDPRAVYNYVKEEMEKFHIERVYALFLDADDFLLGVLEVGIGTQSSAHSPLRQLVDCAVLLNATQVIHVHNHPNGNSMPSAADIKLQSAQSKVLKELGIYWPCSVVVGHSEFSVIRHDLITTTVLEK